MTDLLCTKSLGDSEVNRTWGAPGAETAACEHQRRQAKEAEQTPGGRAPRAPASQQRPGWSPT
jgi:hypothetical protein